LTQNCGSGDCVGIQTCSIGEWDNCSTKDNDVGVCAVCDEDGIPVYDEIQDGDCNSTICPADGCGVYDCETNIFGDYPDFIPNECSDIYTCTQNICTAVCEDDNDNDDYSVSCGDCNETDVEINPEADEICDDNIDNDCDGFIDLIDPDCQVCTITSLEWSSTEVNDKDRVTILIGARNCSGELMNLTIIEKDTLTLDDTINETFDIPFTDRINWTAVYLKDERGTPEFYFEIEINGDVYSLLDYAPIAEPLLHVLPVERLYEQRTIYLKIGKNPFSIPLMLDNMSIEHIFRDVKGKAERLYTYDEGWKIYYFDNRPSNLFELQPSRGYMLFMNDSANLTVYGSVLNPDLTYPRFNLKQGWNLIGTFSIQLAVEYILQGVSYSGLYLYDKSSNNYTLVEPGTILNETESYWINVTDDSILSPIIGEAFIFPVEPPKKNKTGTGG